MSNANVPGTTGQSNRAVRLTSTISIAADAYIAAALLLLHFLRPEFDPVTRVISNYAVGPYGFFMTAAFLAFAVSILSLTFAIYKGVLPPARSRVGLAFLALSGVGFLIVAMFPTDLTPDDSPVTTVGAIHILASVLSIASFVVAALLLSRRLSSDPRWASFQRTPSILALACLAAFIAFFVIRPLSLPIGGIGQRLLVITMLLWLAFTGNHLRSVSAPSATD